MTEPSRPIPSPVDWAYTFDSDGFLEHCERKGMGLVTLALMWYIETKPDIDIQSITDSTTGMVDHEEFIDKLVVNYKRKHHKYLYRDADCMG